MGQIGETADRSGRAPVWPEDSSATLISMDWPWGRLQRAGAVALVLGSLAVALLRCSFSDDVPFVRPSESVPWRMAQAEGHLKGKSVTEGLLREAAQKDLAQARPLEENAYKADLLETAVCRAGLSVLD